MMCSDDFSIGVIRNLLEAAFGFETMCIKAISRVTVAKTTSNEYECDAVTKAALNASISFIAAKKAVLEATIASAVLSEAESTLDESKTVAAKTAFIEAESFAKEAFFDFFESFEVLLEAFSVLNAKSATSEKFSKPFKSKKPNFIFKVGLRLRRYCKSYLSK